MSHKIPKGSGDWFIKYQGGKLEIKAKGPLRMIGFSETARHTKRGTQVLLKFLAFWINCGHLDNKDVYAFTMVMRSKPAPEKITELIDKFKQTKMEAIKDGYKRQVNGKR